MVAPNICGSSLWNLVHINLAPRTLRWLLDFWKIYMQSAVTTIATTAVFTHQYSLAQLIYNTYYFAF